MLEYNKQSHNSLTGGAIDATPIGGTTPAAGAFTTISASTSVTVVDPDIAHGMTTLASTDTFGKLSAISGTVGGLDIVGLTDATQDGALRLTGVIGAADPTDTHAAVHLRGGKVDGTGWTDLAAAETVLRLSNHEADLITVLGNGNVGIGTVAPDYKLHVNGSFALNNPTNPAVKWVQSVGTDYAMTIAHNSAAGGMSLILGTKINGGESVRINGGNVGIGTTDLDGTPAVGQLTVKGTTTDGSTLIFVGRDSDEANVITIDTDGDILNSAGVYGTISDEKLKGGIKDATAKLSDLLKVKVRHFNLKSKPDLKQLGVVAQELETVFPGMVTSTPDMERVLDLDWVPKTQKRQKAETKTVESPKTEILEIDGRHVRKTIIEMVDETVPIFDEVPLYSESGEMLMQMVSPAKEAVLDEEGNEIEPAMEAVYAPVMHRIPRMEEYTETEDQRPMIVQPTGTVTKSVKTSVFIPMLIKAVQELADRVEDLEKRK